MFFPNNSKQQGGVGSAFYGIDNKSKGSRIIKIMSMNMKKYLLGLVFALLATIFASPVQAKLLPIVQDDFETYTNGSILGQGGWTNYANGDNFVVQDTVAYRSQKALHNNSLGDSVITKFGTPLSDGKQVIYVRTENRSSWGTYADGNTQVRLSKGQSFASSIFVGVSFKSDGNVAYYDPVADVYKNFATYKDNEWAKLVIEWRSSDKTARYKVNRQPWTSWQTFKNASSFTDFDNVGFDFFLPSGSGGIYFDNLR